MNREKINHCVETLGMRGCTEVLESIRLLEAGTSLPETAELTNNECEAVLNELKSAMAVYTARNQPPC